MTRFLTQSPLRVGPFTAGKVMRWQPSIVLWGASAAGFVTLFMSGVPLFKKDVLLHVPVLREYFVDRTPDSDKPF